MQGARHIDAGRVAVEAGEGDIACAKVGAGLGQEGPQRDTAPLADLTPALDADVAGDLLSLLCNRRGRRSSPARPVSCGWEDNRLCNRFVVEEIGRRLLAIQNILRPRNVPLQGRRTIISISTLISSL
jgi:hypothetical protein